MSSLRLQLLLTLLIAAGPGYGCGDDDIPVPDASMTMDGGGLDGGGSGIEPARLEVQVSPSRTIYLTGQDIRIETEVFDGSDVLLVGAPVTLTTPEQASALGPDTFHLDSEGYVRFSVCADALAANGSPVCGFAQILVDDGSPNLEVTAPLPGAELGGLGESQFLVEGSVADSRDVTVYVNGDPVSLDEMGAFSFAVTDPLFGINHLHIAASDGVSPESQVQMDVLWASEYREGLEDQTGVRVQDGLALQFGQDFFDDRTPPVGLTSRDLTDVFQLILENADLQTLLPNPLIDSSGIRLISTDTRMRDVRVVMDVVDDGLELFVQIGALELDTTGEFRIDSTTLDLDGGLSAALSAHAHITLIKESVDAPITSETTGLEVAIESVQGRFVSEEANAILALAEGLLRSRIEALLSDSLGTTLVSAIPAVLVDGLRSLDTSLRDQTFVLDTGVFLPMTLGLDGRLSRLETNYRRGLLAPMDFTLTSDQESMHPETRGVPDLSVPDQSVLFRVPVSLALRVAVINGLLHTLWESGLLDIEATELLPESARGLVESAILHGKMTPMIRASRGGETGDFIFALGQLELELELLGDTVTYGMTIEAGATVDITDGAFTLAVDEDPEIRVWIIESTTASPAIDEATLRSLVNTQLWPSLRDNLLPGLNLALPSFALGDLSAIAPPLAGFELSIGLVGDVRVREHALVAELEILGAIPE